MSAAALPGPDSRARGAVAEPVSTYSLVGRELGEPLFRTTEGPITGAAFLDRAHTLAAELPAGAHILNLCHGRYAFTLAFAAAMLRGQVSLLSSDRTMSRIQELARSFPGLSSVSDSPEQPSPLRHYVIRPENEEPRSDRPNPRIPASQLAALVFTSGSTGEPVAHRKNWGALVSRSADAGRRFRMGRGAPASIVATVPPQHMYGFETSVLLQLHAPAAAWCGEAFYPLDVRLALEAVPPPRILVTTPLQIRALLQASVDLPPIERVISATAPLFPELAAEAERAWSTRVEEIFGATEVGSIASRRTVDGDTWTMYPRVRLARTSGEEDAEALVTAPHAQPFPLGDIVEVLDPAHFRLLGRRTDLVKLGGRRASLAGLNRILTGIDGVIDGLFVAPDDLDRRPTARLLAFVVAPGREASDILAALRERIDPIFLPRRVISVSSLPRNGVGKLPEQALKALLAQLGEG